MMPLKEGSSVTSLVCENFSSDERPKCEISLFCCSDATNNASLFFLLSIQIFILTLFCDVVCCFVFEWLSDYFFHKLWIADNKVHLSMLNLVIVIAKELYPYLWMKSCNSFPLNETIQGSGRNYIFKKHFTFFSIFLYVCSLGLVGICEEL